MAGLQKDRSFGSRISTHHQPAMRRKLLAQSRRLAINAWLRLAKTLD